MPAASALVICDQSGGYVRESYPVLTSNRSMETRMRWRLKYVSHLGAG